MAMFNLFSSTASATPATVKEVNEHMQAMHNRIVDLEQRVREQTELLHRRESEHKAHAQHIIKTKDLAIQEAEQEAQKLSNHIKKMENLMKERDCQIAYLLHRCSYLDEAASYAPILENLSVCLKSAFTSNPPKIQSVKPIGKAQPSESDENPADVSKS